MNPVGMPLTPSLYEEIEEQMRALRVLYGVKTPSEYAFSNLYLFRHAHDYRYFRGDLPFVVGNTYDGMRHVLPLFDPRQASRTELLTVLGENDCLFPIPDAALTDFDARSFYWTESRDDADYFYPAENFRTYRGDLLRKKRNLMHQLQVSYRITVEPLRESSVVAATSILDAWMRDKQKLPGEADDGACREALYLQRDFSMEGLIFYADEHPVGFLVAQQFSPEAAVIRFAKGRESHKGIYQYMFHHYCASRSNLKWINFEQDLGLLNFRQTKRSYQPSAMISKYRIWPRV